MLNPNRVRGICAVVELDPQHGRRPGRDVIAFIGIELASTMAVRVAGDSALLETA